ncbi:SDR family oxidoreductase [Pseudoxanthomonas sp. PXM01]|uniref:SDR family oxidoreductase n=1 Tax=Pseudoxanthomonas sp. PXM01 TaxID=2769295 RepID=UPI00178718AD|nr:SDR family oxidoreductase [Pseudoxanthomonas sp. PXM01]MBD9469618.1 SDR family oxidoreductase [Pseudoxanthomonas sp. PXM01]
MSAKRVVVVGGTGLIGSKLVSLLRAAGHDAVAAALDTGVNTVTGAGLSEAMQGAEVVVDVSNAPSFEEQAVRAFFEQSGRNIARVEADAGVRHHVLLSIVGSDRMPGNGYFNAKVAQENVVKNSGIPFTIVRSTQFFEFLGGIADGSVVEGVVRLAGGMFQPIAADDVAAALADVATGGPLQGTVEIAGPEREPFNVFVRRYLQAVGDPRAVERDPAARYFGGEVLDDSLVPLGQTRLGKIDFESWIRRRLAA